MSDMGAEDMMAEAADLARAADLAKPPSCTDGVKNGGETDLDCGGSDCGPCVIGKACAKNADCASAACEMNKCVALFAEPTKITSRVTTDKMPWGVAAADFDLDGFPDLAFANSGSSSIGVVLGVGNGTFGWRTNYTVSKETNAMMTAPWSIRVVDINGDSRPDLLVSNNQGLGVDVFVGNGAGWFQYFRPLWMGGATRDTATGDVNGDGLSDLVSANYFGVALRVWSVINGDWSGAFGAGNDLGVDYDTVAVEVGDVNGDMNLDIVVASEKPSTISVLLGGGNAQFTPKLERPMATPKDLKLFDVGFSPRDIQLIDINKDKFLDIVVADASSNEVCVILGDGNGVFEPAQHYGLPGSASQVAVADVNSDGLLDIVVAHNDMSVLLGKKDGSWADPVTYTFNYKINNLAVADFNIDGRPDLAVTGSGTDQVIILLNQSH